MRYLKYIFGVQLFFGFIWAFYYSIYWVSFILLALSLVILTPLMYQFLVKKLKGKFEAICAMLVFFFVLIPILILGRFWYVLMPVNASNKTEVLAFEKKLTEATQPCFRAFDQCFHGSLKDKNAQCNAIMTSTSTCQAAQHSVNNITIPNTLDNRIFSTLNEAKVDANNTLKSWENIFSEYTNQCMNASPANVNNLKMQLISAKQNEYLMNINVNKAKSLAGIE